MLFEDTLSYLIFGNPISQTFISAAVTVAKSIEHIAKNPPKTASSTNIPRSMTVLAGHNYNFVRLAGLSGAAAVILGGYGKHSLASISDEKDKIEAKAVFDTANRFHFLHTFAIMMVPIARRPELTGSLMVFGTILFTGPMYYRALTGDKKFIHIATCGGFCLIAAWLTLIF